MDDLYPSTLSTESNPAGLAEILSRMDGLDAEMRKLQKKKEGDKAGSKKNLKKQLEQLQQENQQMKYFLIGFATSQQQQQQYKSKKKRKKKNKVSTSSWWHNALANSIPVVLNNLTRSKPQYLPQNNKTLYLSDDRDRN